MVAKRTGVAFCICVAAIVASAACGGEPDDKAKARQEMVCSDDGLVNVVDAPTWASERAGIDTYRYTADVRGGSARVDLLDGDREKLGSMTVRQVFGADDTADGAMEAILDAETDRPLRLTTRGERIDERGYTVRARLEQPENERSLHVDARFETVQCWDPDAPLAGPPCASGLALDSRSITLPTCGLIADERIRKRRPPALAELSYAVRADQTDGAPSVGGARRDGDTLFYRIQVRGAGGDREPSTVETWLEETGFQEIVGTPRERLVTTAFLDRSWWRMLDRHVAHCDIQRLPRPEVTASDDNNETTDASGERTTTQTLCPGDENSDAWGSEDDTDAARVWGDPHLVSFDGHSYELQAAGEFVLFRAHKGDPIEVQGRFEPVGDAAIPECGNVSWTTVAATEVSGRRVTVTAQPAWEVRIDGEQVRNADDIPELDDGASIEAGLRFVRVRWPGGEEVEFSIIGAGSDQAVGVDAVLPPERLGQVRGLFGQFDRDPATDLVLPDGAILDQPASFEALYDVLAPSWLVREQDSLFDYDDGTSTEDYYLSDFPASPLRVDMLPPELVADAETTCLEEESITDPHLLQTCIIDVVCLDDPEQAQPSADTEPPFSSQAPGRHDAAVHGAVRRVSPPATVTAEPTTDVSACEPVVDPSIAMFDERSRVSLAENLEAELTEPGTYGTDHGASGSTLPAGTEVSSFQILRTSSNSPNHPHRGGVRFARPILAVIADPSQTRSTDASLGSADTTYDGKGFDGFRTPDDSVTISEDRRTVDIVWRGKGSRRLRVLTEAPSP